MTAETAATASLEGLERLTRSHPSLTPLIRAPRGWPILFIAIAAVVALGFAAWIMQLMEGLSVTGMNNQANWSLYIINFMFFIGASAGGIIVGALAHAIGIERFRPVARLAEVTALTALTLAVLSILLDIGRPERAWHMLRYPSFTSPLVWDVMIISVYGALAFGLVYFSIRQDLARLAQLFPGRRRLYTVLALGRLDLSAAAIARDHKTLRALSILSIPIAVLLHSVTAWILGLVKAQPGWHTAIIAPLFITSAVVSGVALTILSSLLSRHFLHVPIKDPVVQAMADILLWALPVLGYFLFSEMLTNWYPREPKAGDVFREMVFGRYRPVFWFELLAALALPFILLVRRRTRTTGRIAVAAALVVMGVFAERWNILLPPQLGHSHLPYAAAQYTPTLLELLLVASVWAAGALGYVVLARLFPMMELEVEHESVQAGAEGGTR
jgi:molybdopterin-containing oxidoreductase family membrane subunit